MMGIKPASFIPPSPRVMIQALGDNSTAVRSELLESFDSTWEPERRPVGASVAVVQNARKASLVAGLLVHVVEPKSGAKKSRRRKPYSSARHVGRPSGYRPELAERAYRMSLLGLTDQQLADFLRISCETLYSWKISYPEFRESISRGKTAADAHVADALYRRARGYRHDAV